MRLTLRTLLAYLDDILEPAQAKEIGQKINESTYASGLVTRIREVMRRRRLSAADPLGSGTGLDANTVAEYLDNALTPEVVTDVEKICLDSDLHLAEVAACHQILTLVLGEPVDVDPNCRERMYALGPVSAQQSLAEPSGGNGQAVRGGVAQPAVPTTRDPSASFAATVPEYLRRKPLWRRILPYVLVSAIAAAWLALIVFDESIFPSRDGEQTVASTEDREPETPAPDSASAAPAAKTVASRSGGTESKTPAKSEPAKSEPRPAEASESPAGEAGSNVAGIDPEPPAEEPGTGLTGAETVTPETAAVEGPAAPATPVTPGDTPAESAGETPSSPETPSPSTAADTAEPTDTTTSGDTAAPAETVGLRYESEDAVALMFDEELREWYVLRPESLVNAADHLVVPEPFTARLVDPQERFEIDIVGGSALELLGTNDAGPVGVNTWQCRLVLRGLGDSGNGAAEEDLAVGIAVANELWRVELLTSSTVCGLEISPNPPRRPNQESAELGYTSQLYVLEGAVRFADGAQVKVVSENQQISLSRADRLPAPAAAETEGTESTAANFAAKPLTELPAWLDPATSSSAIAKRMAQLFASEFAVDEPVSSSIPPLIRSPRPRTAELAIRCLALISDIPTLVSALRLAEHEEARIAAIEGIRNWLPRSASHDAELQEELRRTFPPDDAKLVHRLLWGYRPEDLAEESTSMHLIDLLEHDDIAIRELAFYYVQGLTNRRLEYRPNLPAAQRNTLVRRLRTNVMRDGALITPGPTLPDTEE